MIARSHFILFSLFAISAWAQPPALADQHSHTGSIIDLNNMRATEYAPDTSAPCQLFFDSQGIVMAQFCGRANKTSLTEVSAALTSVVPGTVAITDNTP
jgi:hypothetical protein